MDEHCTTANTALWVGGYTPFRLIPFCLNYAMQSFTYFFENRGVNDVTLTSSKAPDNMAGQVMPNFRFIPTKRGDKTFFDEYIFRVKRRIGTKKYWKCHVADCKVTAVSDGINIVKNPDTTAHCHP